MEYATSAVLATAPKGPPSPSARSQPQSVVAASTQQPRGVTSSPFCYCTLACRSVCHRFVGAGPPKTISQRRPRRQFLFPPSRVTCSPNLICTLVVRESRPLMLTHSQKKMQGDTSFHGLCFRHASSSLQLHPTISERITFTSPLIHHAKPQLYMAFGLALHVHPPPPYPLTGQLGYQIPALRPRSESFIIIHIPVPAHFPPAVPLLLVLISSGVFRSSTPGTPRETPSVNIWKLTLDNVATEELDLRTKLAQAAASHLDNSEAASDEARTSLPHQPVPLPAQPHGYNQPSINSQTHIHPQLRVDANLAPALDTMPPGPSGMGPSSSAASAMAVQDLIDHDPDISGPDGRKAKRELSQSKRAAQNRAAQRAFRQRKEHYIKKLEQQVRDYNEMEHSYKAIQNDNYALREYVIQLQSRLLDVQGEVPQPPPNLQLPPPPRPAPPAPSSAIEPATNGPSAGSLADVAAAVNGLRAHGAAADGYSDGYSKFKAENEGPRRDDDARRLHEPLPPSSSLRA
ncbi:bZIP transcription factor [Seiridium cupressi]